MIDIVDVDPLGIDDAKAEALLKCYYLAEFLSESIVADKYKSPVQLTTSFTLAPKGKSLANQAKGDGVSLAEAQLAAFLTTWAGDELLFDPLQTEFDALREQISSEIKRGNIRYPWIYGRGLYDAVADSTFHGDPNPGHEETLELIGDLPPGVFQLGPYVCGPYGLVESNQWRNLAPNLLVPGFHCEEMDCSRIHQILLTSGESGVTKARGVIRRRTAKIHKPSMQYVDAIAKIQAKNMPSYSWVHSGTLPFFLFDAFSLSELRLLLEGLLDSSSDLRSECGKLGVVVNKATTFVAKLRDAELLQILLMANGSSIHSMLNKLVWNGSIQIPAGETRKSQMRPGGLGPLGVRVEVSSLGVRFRPTLSLTQVRLQQIVADAFPSDNSARQKRLQWLLRNDEGDTAGAKLANALASYTPLDLTTKLIASDEYSYDIALRRLALPQDVQNTSSDDEIGRLIAWHIGFVSTEGSTELANLLQQLSTLKKLVRGLPVGQLDRQEIAQIRQLASNLFVSLEEVLKHSACFICWALLNDHFATGYPLTYSPNRAADFLSTWLKGQDSRIESLELDKFSLGNLLECFGLLGRQLIRIEDTRNEFVRDELEWPRSFRISGNPLQFPFAHKHPFLDLDRESRRHIIDLVSSVASSLNNAGALEVRNGLMHHTSNVPDQIRIGNALDVIEARITELSNNGLFPLVYVLSNTESDNFGRGRIVLKSADGPDVTLTRPTSLGRVGFPALGEPQSIVAGARISESGEPLRFSWKLDSSYEERWRDFPRRPPARKGLTQDTQI